MSTFDENESVVNDETTQTPVESTDSTNQDSAYYHNTETGQRPSPYASSPYAGYGQTYGTASGAYQQPPMKPKKKRSGIGRRIAAGLLTVAVVAAGCGITAYTVNSRWENRFQFVTENMDQRIADLEKQIAAANAAPAAPVYGSPVSSGSYLTPGQLYSQNVDSVVAISSTIHTTVYGRITEGTGSGSGFILTDSGYIATNYHVIQDATKVTVTTYAGKEYDANIIGYDSTIDLAVLKIDAEDLPAVTLGSSTDLSIGDMVVAIGNPLGELTATQTVGYVSGKNREVTTDNTVISMIQTDAAINPGNSGGPLFNMKGEVVGITTAKYSGTTSGGATIEGIGFAIPMDDIASMINDLKDHGYVSGAYLGVSVTDIDENAAARYNLPTGAYVESLVSGGSADQAGVKQGDIITALGETPVTSSNELIRALRQFKAGDTTTITVLRSGQQLHLEITLDEKPQTSTPATEDAAQDEQIPADDFNDELYEYFRRFFGYGN